MYEIHFYAPDGKFYVRTAKNLKTLEEARDARKVNGDVVCFSNSLIPVKEEIWLWDWEKEDPNSYARKAMLKGKTLVEMETYRASVEG